jgi:hypothetical protein
VASRQTVSKKELAVIKKNVSGALFVALLMILCVTTGHAVEVDMDVKTEVAVLSSYVWRGLVFNDESVIQPGVTVGAGDCEFNIWGTWDLTDVTNSSARTRMDVSLDYFYRNGKNSLTTGVKSYIYHDDANGLAKDTFEAFLGYALDVPTTPGLELNFDFGEVKGAYGRLKFGHIFVVEEANVGIVVQATVGAGDEDYVNYHFNSSTNANMLEASLLDVTATVKLPWVVNEAFTITPSVRYMALLDSEIKKAVRDEEEDQVIYGISAAVQF